MGYFKSIWGIQLAISSLIYDCNIDDRNKASKSDNNDTFGNVQSQSLFEFCVPC